MVSVCDRVVERAKERSEKFNVPHYYGSLDEMLKGASFDLLVNTTDIQSHYAVSKTALQAGKNVWSEKTMAYGLENAQELLALAKAKGVKIWGAPTAIMSPQFAFMSKAYASGRLGKVAAAHASYGHLGPDWASFFYEEGGGTLRDLGCYDMTFLTGLFGPAREVIAATSIITPVREIIRDKKTVKVNPEDNSMVIMYHDNGVLSHVQASFNYFDASDHTYDGANHETIDIFGRDGEMHLAGYSWAPHWVSMGTKEEKGLKKYASEPHTYVWQNGASHIAECMATGATPQVIPEQAVHIAEVIHAAHESQRTGRRIKIQSTFDKPVHT
jgi:predicted dehydrogenase